MNNGIGCLGTGLIYAMIVFVAPPITALISLLLTSIGSIFISVKRVIYLIIALGVIAGISIHLLFAGNASTGVCINPYSLQLFISTISLISGASLLGMFLGLLVRYIASRVAKTQREAFKNTRIALITGLVLLVADLGWSLYNLWPYLLGL